MKRSSDISDEHLNAFLDGELDGEEHGRLLDAAQDDRELAARVCELRHVKELTRHAYSAERPPTKGGGPDARSRGMLAKALAAGLVLALGVLAGWLAREAARAPERVAGFFTVEEARQLAAVSNLDRVNHIILHVSTDEPAKVEAALDTTEELLRAYRSHGRPIRLEVIANADGLDLLRRDVSRYSQRVRRMMAEYRGLTFLACNRAVTRLQGKGVRVQLLPDTRLAPSALELIIQRLREGWVYVKA